MAELKNEIDTKENKKKFMKNLEFFTEQLKEMDHHCFKDAQIDLYWNSLHDQSGRFGLYIGTGTTGPPPGGDW